MLSRINSATVHGITAIPVIIETDISRGMPNFKIVGLADTTVKESKDRVRSAIINTDLKFPQQKITINMAPASVRKKGSHFDLPLAMGIITSANLVFSEEIEKYCFIGELSLYGTVNKVKGVLPMVMALKKSGIEKFVIPWENKEEVALVDDINILPVKTLEDVLNHFNKSVVIKPFTSSYLNEQIEIGSSELGDYSDVLGQEYAKRAITVAVAGGHGLLMTGSPATGKTMLSERIPSIMPEMSYDEVVNSTVIYSVAGLLTEDMPVINKRPFRIPHHKVTPTGLLGGGAYPRPGEITLAHNGVLFLDEVGEFDRNTIDTLRIPLEEKKISLIRNGETYIYPCNFLLICATNPCKCGYYGDPTHECKCNKKEIDVYQNKLSGPILDRIDMHIRLAPMNYHELTGEETSSSEDMRRLIVSARKIQMERYKHEKINLNNQLNDHLVKKYCNLSFECEKLLSVAYEKMKLNPRAVMKIKKIARTIADIEGVENLKESHIAEAIQYRNMCEVEK